MIDTPMIAARSIDGGKVGRHGEPGRRPTRDESPRAFWRDVLGTDFVNPPRCGRTWHRQRTLTVVLAIALIAAWRSIGG